MKLHNPTYNSETNKIVAELNGASIEIEVDDELKEFVEREFLLNAMKTYNPDITPIMDRIEVTENKKDYSGNVSFNDLTPTYIAKLKQVDKVEDNEMVSKTEMFEFTKWCIINRWDTSSWSELIMLHQETQKQCSIQELYELFKNQK